MTPLTTEAAILAYMRKQEESATSGHSWERGEVTAFELSSAVIESRRRPTKLLERMEADDLVRSRLIPAVSRTEKFYRLSAKGRRLLAKHREAVAAAYGMEP